MLAEEPEGAHRSDDPVMSVKCADPPGRRPGRVRRILEQRRRAVHDHCCEDRHDRNPRRSIDRKPGQRGGREGLFKDAWFKTTLNPTSTSTESSPRLGFRFRKELTPSKTRIIEQLLR